MVEFTLADHVARLADPCNVIWHSRAGFLASQRQGSIHVPFGLGNSVQRPIVSTNDPWTVIVHGRARSLDAERMARHLLMLDERVKVILWNNVGPRGMFDHVAGPRCRVLDGSLDRNAWLSLAASAGVYVAGRAMEGVGLCAMEAAAMGCAIAGPEQTTTGEYFDSSHGGITTPLREISQDGWLTKRYDWGIDYECADTLASHIVSAMRRGIVCNHGRDAMQAENMASHAFDLYVVEFMSCLKPRVTRVFPPSRRRILSIQTCAWGGQGLFEAWMIREMSRRSHLSVFACRMWMQKYDKAEQTEHADILSGSSARLVAPHFDDLCSVDPEIVVFHWNASFAMFVDEGQLDEVRQFLASKGKARIIVMVHEISPGNVEPWLHDAADMFIFPSEHAMVAHKPWIKKPCRVLGHFVDQDILSFERKTHPSAFTMGVIGRVVWSKLDPAYWTVLGKFLDRWPGSSILWLGPSSDGYIEGDAQAASTIRPRHVSEFGHGRIDVIDSMTIGLCLMARPESWCLAAVEMVCRGVPVVTNRPEIEAILGPACIRVDCPEDLGHLLTSMASDATVLTRLKRACSAFKPRTYTDWETEFLSTCVATHPMKWSIVVTCHNVEDHIDACLASAVANEPERIVVVLDGCNDRTETVVERYAANNPGLFHVIHSAEAHCQAWSLARGFEACLGELVAILDGDDMMVAGALTRMSVEFASNPNLVFAWSDQVVIDPRGDLVDVSFSCDPGELTILDSVMAGKNTVSHLMTMRRSALRLIMLDEDLQASADKDLAFKLEEIGHTKFVPEKLYIYKWMRPGSVTSLRRDLQESCGRLAASRAVVRRSRRHSLTQVVRSSP
jgi:hypothetical protein